MHSELILPACLPRSPRLRPSKSHLAIPNILAIHKMFRVTECWFGSGIGGSLNAAM